MRTEDLTDPDNSYYRDNLLSVLRALELLGNPANTGDWHNEVVAWLVGLGADPEYANMDPKSLAVDIYECATSTPITEVMALIPKSDGQDGD